ncbi:MAG: VIT1/CCC1 transporter family protein [Firmicutes bacterium]|nr:VIT1/CCC1 transporter family protein [Bacillota bacterium]
MGMGRGIVAEHPKAGAAEPWHQPSRGAALRDLVLGASDGLVTVLSFAAGVSASLGSSHQVVLAGISEMFAGATSMGLGAYLGARSQHEYYQQQRVQEEYEMRTIPEVEREEVRNIFAKKGFSGALLDEIVETITSDEQRWLDTMMREEVGVDETSLGRPVRSGMLVGLSYIVGALFPLFPYFLFSAWPALFWSIGITFIALFAQGWAKAAFTAAKRWPSALQTVAMGACGTAVCYFISRAVVALIGG